MSVRSPFLMNSMRMLTMCALGGLLVTSGCFQRQTPSDQVRASNGEAAESSVADLLAANVNTEWEAFQRQDKEAYSDLLAEDFAAVEDDNQGMRNKNAAAGEVDRRGLILRRMFSCKLLDGGSKVVIILVRLADHLSFWGSRAGCRQI